MHFFVWLVGFLLVVMIVGLICGVVYLSYSEPDLSVITVKTFGTTFGNGIDMPPLWTGSAIILKDDPLQGLFANIVWGVQTALSNQSDPLIIGLPVTPVELRVFVLTSLNVFVQGSFDGLRGIIYGVKGVALMKTLNGIDAGLMTGADIDILVGYELGLVIAYSTV